MKDLVKLVVTALVLASMSYFVGMGVAKADTIKVAVIDTGFDFKSQWPTNKDYPTPKLCKDGHMDFVNPKTNPNYLKDNHGHGTHIAGLIAKYATEGYCLLIIKFYDSKAVSNNLDNTVKSFNYAIEQGVDIINFSGGGLHRSELECNAVKRALDKGIVVVTSTGNEGGKPYYPAMCDDRVIMVANIDVKNRTIASSSNLNSDSIGINGTRVYSLLPNGQYGYMTGTSQATAIVTGKLVKTLTIVNTKRSNKRDLRTTSK